MPKLAVIATISAVAFPWQVRRLILCALCGYKIHRSAYISRISLVMPQRLEMGANSYIGAMTVVKGIESLRIDEHGFIGALNWIFGFPKRPGCRHFAMDSTRNPCLIVEPHAAITSRHLIDCTDEVVVGAYSTLAGFRSQILTHSIDLQESRQRCRPVHIGRYCFVGTSCVLLAGSVLPDRSVLAAHSVLTAAQSMDGYLYGGTPAKPIKPIAADAKYFSRTSGYVW
jgi:hypothetical protein